MDLDQNKSTAVVISDMRMPGMDGVAFLSLARQAAPHTVRMLLTGHADTKSAIAAVNEGQIFRFLTKPCPPDILQEAVKAAIEQNHLISNGQAIQSEISHEQVIQHFELGARVRVTNGARRGQLGVIKAILPNPSKQEWFQAYLVELDTLKGPISEHYLGSELFMEVAGQ